MLLRRTIWKHAVREWLKSPINPIAFLAGVLSLAANLAHHEPFRLLSILFVTLSLATLLFEVRDARHRLQTPPQDGSS